MSVITFIFNFIVKACIYLFLFMTLPLWLPFVILNGLFNAFPALTGALLLSELLDDDEEDEDCY